MPKLAKGSPLLPTKYEDKHVAAIQALMHGKATEGQQQLALKFIIEDVCSTYDEPYRPDSERDTTFALGKRHAGMEIVKLTKVKMGKLK
jgi:hypothetical protein